MSQKIKYIVCDAEDVDFLMLIEADCEEELNQKILTVVSNNTQYRNSVNEGLDGYFLHDEKGRFWDEYGNLRPDLEQQYDSKKELNSYIEGKVTENVTNFFGENIEWAKLFLNTFEVEDTDSIELPSKLYEYCFKKQYGYNFDSWLKLMVRKLDDLPIL